MNHNHLDLGSFVLDALGQRWAVDLGADDYNLPGYFGGQRYTYYRLRAEGHNTLVLNPGQGPDQDPRPTARIARFVSEPDRAIRPRRPHAGLRTSTRSGSSAGVALLDRRRVLVQDEVEADKPVDLWWFMHTPADDHAGRRRPHGHAGTRRSQAPGPVARPLGSPLRGRAGGPVAEFSQAQGPERQRRHAQAGDPPRRGEEYAHCRALYPSRRRRRRRAAGSPAPGEVVALRAAAHDS